MATVKKSVKKAQVGKSVPKKKAVVDSVPSEMFPGKMIPRSKSNYENTNIGKMAEATKTATKTAPKKKMKSGGSFPDLNKDGKITKKDILIGKGVLPKTAKKGMKMKKAKTGTSVPKNTSVSKNIGNLNKAKKGASIKKCKYGCK